MTRAKTTAEEVLREYSTYDLPEFINVPLDNVDAVGLSGTRPLHVACSRGKPEEVEALVMAGADVNASGDIGNTPLHDAVSANSAEIVKILLAAGANPSIANELGQTPEEVANIMGHQALVRALQGG